MQRQRSKGVTRRPPGAKGTTWLLRMNERIGARKKSTENTLCLGEQIQWAMEFYLRKAVPYLQIGDPLGISTISQPDVRCALYFRQLQSLNSSLDQQPSLIISLQGSLHPEDRSGSCGVRRFSAVQINPLEDIALPVTANRHTRHESPSI